MSMELISTESVDDYNEIETFKCTDCGRIHSVWAGGDIACCPCEFEGEDNE